MNEEFSLRAEIREIGLLKLIAGSIYGAAGAIAWIWILTGDFWI